MHNWGLALVASPAQNWNYLEFSQKSARFDGVTGTGCTYPKTHLPTAEINAADAP